MRVAFALAGLATLAPLAPAHASDEAFEFWLDPSVSVALDGDTGLELETAQRFRDAGDGRADTYYARLWINQKLSDAFTVSGGAERRINDPGPDETRFLQQLSIRRGALRTRLRIEQRIVGGERLALRFRPRLGAELPLNAEGRWSLNASAEGFVTLRSTSEGGKDGFTGLRTQIGASYDVNDRLSLSLAYLRQQDIQDGPDRVGHAPVIGAELSF